MIIYQASCEDIDLSCMVRYHGTLKYWILLDTIISALNWVPYLVMQMHVLGSGCDSLSSPFDHCCYIVTGTLHVYHQPFSCGDTLLPANTLLGLFVTSCFVTKLSSFTIINTNHVQMMNVLWNKLSVFGPRQTA